MKTLTEFEKFRKECKEEDNKIIEFQNEWERIRESQPKTERYKPISVFFSFNKKCPLCGNVLIKKGFHYDVIYKCKCGYEYADYNPPSL